LCWPYTDKCRSKFPGQLNRATEHGLICHYFNGKISNKQQSHAAAWLIGEDFCVPDLHSAKASCVRL
jgi:hypothetical protein